MFTKKERNKISIESLFKTGGTITSEKDFELFSDIKYIAKEGSKDEKVLDKIYYKINNNDLILIYNNMIKIVKIEYSPEYTYKMLRTKIKAYNLEKTLKEASNRGIFAHVIYNNLIKQYF